jgi:hypothetical protein
MRIEIDQAQQLNTSLTETFSTADITASGLIASWSSLATSVAVSSFTSIVTIATDFGRNAFVFNGDAVSERFVQTPAFAETQRLDLTIDYLVGDNYNGGENPDGSEDLVVQYSLNNGATWTQFLKLWEGGSSNVNAICDRVVCNAKFVSGRCTPGVLPRGERRPTGPAEGIRLWIFVAVRAREHGYPRIGLSLAATTLVALRKSRSRHLDFRVSVFCIAPVGRTLYAETGISGGYLPDPVTPEAWARMAVSCALGR